MRQTLIETCRTCENLIVKTYSEVKVYNFEAIMVMHSRLEWIIKKSHDRGERQLGCDRGNLWGS